METIGQRIKKIRKEKGLTLKELALIIEMSPSNLSEIESGKYLPSAPALIRISEYFSVDPGWLLSGDDDQKSLAYQPQKSDIPVIRDELFDPDIKEIIEELRKKPQLKDLVKSLLRAFK